MVPEGYALPGTMPGRDWLALACHRIAEA